MDRNCLSFSSGSHLLSTKILYEKPSLHIFEYALPSSGLKQIENGMALGHACL